MRFNQYINEGINDKGIFKSIIMAGTPGSGKSYILNKISSGSITPKVVNTDTWTEFFKAYGTEKWGEYKEKVKILTKGQLSMYLNSMLPLWIDGTSANPPATMKRTGILKSIGYDVGMVWVETSVETALERASKRERPVDPDFIVKVHKDIQKLKPYYKSEFKYFITVKNDNGELNDKTITDAFKKTTNFFTSPLINPIGQLKIDKMKDNGWKYLVDQDNMDISDIKKLVDAWYRK